MAWFIFAIDCCLNQRNERTVTYTGVLAALSTVDFVKNQVNCTFESGSCQWTQGSSDDFDWTRINGPTPTDDTGPDVDHSIGTSSGHYLFIETSAPRKLGEAAVLMSPVIDTYNNNYLCFSMWYFTYGANIGSLKIKLNQTKYLIKEETLWTSNLQGQVWRQASASIKPTGPFQILIEGKVGDGYLGDIAIDDITITSGLCQTNAMSTTSSMPLVG